MHRKIFGLLLLAFCGNALAQNARHFTVALSEDGKATMEAFLPENPSGRAVVECPGGGYAMLSDTHEGTDWAPYFNGQGIAYFVVRYRLPYGDRSLPIGDVQSAMRMVRDSSNVWSVNPYDVGIMGCSAGGHLASTVSTHSDVAVRPNFQILFYPVITMGKGTHDSSRHFFLGDDAKDEKLQKEYSNQFFARRHVTPPAVIILSSDDDLVKPVENGIAYYSALVHAGVPAALYCYPKGNHGYGFGPWFPFHDQMVNDLTTWLKALPSPQKEAKRVACIGNSITDGHGINMSDIYAYPARMQENLGNAYNVRNFGMSGRTMLNKGDQPYMKENAWKEALACNPDIAVIKLGTNDSKPGNWKHGKEFQKDMQEMIDQLKALPSNPKIYLCTPITALKPSWGISDSVIVSEIIPIIKKVAKKNKLQIIDLHTEMPNDEKLLLKDGIHPNTMGADKMAKIIGDAIRQ